MTHRVRLAALACLAAGATTGAIVATHDTGPACRTQTSTVVVDLDNQRHTNILNHAWAAIQAGQPRLLHLDRQHAEEHRAHSLRGIPTRPGYDRDEYPPAVSSEGGDGAHVAYVRSAENRSAGSVMRNQLRGWCDGQAFMYERP